MRFSRCTPLIWDAVTCRGGVEGLAEELAIPAGADVPATRDAINAFVERLCDLGLLADAGPRVRSWWRWRR
jgi:hypothetical protein